jgi:hypothetical protein
VTTSGKLVLKVTLILDAPLSKSIALPDVNVSIPGVQAAIDLGTQPAHGASDAQQGTCGDVPVATMDAGSNDATNDNDNDAPTDAIDEDGPVDPETVLVDSSLVAYYKFNEGSGSVAIDSSGNGHTGTLTGGIKWFGGKSNLAMYFDGATTSADVGKFGFLQGGGSWSVMFWLYSDSVQDNRIVLDVNSDNAVSGPRFRELTVGALELDYENQGLLVGNQAIHQWHHVAMTSDFNAAKVGIYYDGVFQSVSTSSFATAFDHFLVGNGYTNGMSGTHYQGLVDDLRVYSRALSASEVALVYNTQK